MRPSLRVIIGGKNDLPVDRPMVPTSSTPHWWRRTVVLALRNSLFRPWLWPLQLTLIRLRSENILLALHSMRSELGFDGSADFDFVQAFVNAEAIRRHDPAFQAACEDAIRRCRRSLFGQPVILNEEIDNRGQYAIIYHFGWTEGAKRPDPFPKSRDLNR